MYSLKCQNVQYFVLHIEKVFSHPEVLYISVCVSQEVHTRQA